LVSWSVLPAVGVWVPVPVLAAETGVLAVGATWIGPISAPELLPLAAGDWVTVPAPVPPLTAETGTLSVGATWMGPVRVPDPPVLPAVGVWVTLPPGLVEPTETGVLAVGATWIGPIRLPVCGVLGCVPVGGVLGWVPAGGVLGWLGLLPEGGVPGLLPDGRVPCVPGLPDCDVPGSPYCAWARPVPWLPENQKLNCACSTQADALAGRGQLRMPSWRQLWW
jgi:hypothetical protein